MNALLRQSMIALKLLTVMTLLLGVLYPLGIWAVGRLASGPADGSFATNRAGRIVGSALIGQSFTGDRWFWPRPSAAEFDAQSSGGSNLGPDDPRLVASVKQRMATFAAANNIALNAVPADAVTASGSGLDPDISPSNARAQAGRVAAARHLPVSRVQQLIAANTSGRILGFMGEPCVNVLTLNLALEQIR